jgi:hypothetical protein
VVAIVPSVAHPAPRVGDALQRLAAPADGRAAVAWARCFHLTGDRFMTQPAPRALLLQPATARPLGLLGLAVSGLLLMGFHEVVSGGLHQAESQRALREQIAQAEAPCLGLADAAQRQLCILRLETGPLEQLTAAR